MLIYNKISINAFELAQRFVGMEELPLNQDNPQILAMLRLDQKWPEHDEVPWCSAFVNYICWLLRLPRSKDLRARSWLEVGRSVDIEQARVGFDVVILKRGSGNQPGPDVTDAPGHVGFYAGRKEEAEYSRSDLIYLLGGNQGNKVSIAGYLETRILGIRRLFR